MQNRVEAYYEASISTLQAAQRMLTDATLKATQLLLAAVEHNHKIMICGNGGSAADAQHMSAEFINRFERERNPLPAMALTVDTSTLTAIGNDYHFDDVFAKQIMALGQPQDVLIVLSTSGESGNILKAVRAAHARQMPVIAMTGKDGGALAQTLQDTDIELRAPSNRTPHIQEVHGLLIHCICDLMDEVILEGASLWHASVASSA